jgi:hypothetical protein
MAPCGVRAECSGGSGGSGSALASERGWIREEYPGCAGVCEAAAVYHPDDGLFSPWRHVEMEQRRSMGSRNAEAVTLTWAEGVVGMTVTNITVEDRKLAGIALAVEALRAAGWHENSDVIAFLCTELRGELEYLGGRRPVATSE